MSLARPSEQFRPAAPGHRRAIAFVISVSHRVFRAILLQTDQATFMMDMDLHCVECPRSAPRNRCPRPANSPPTDASSDRVASTAKQRNQRDPSIRPANEFARTPSDCAARHRWWRVVHHNGKGFPQSTRLQPSGHAGPFLDPFSNGLSFAFARIGSAGRAKCLYVSPCRSVGEKTGILSLWSIRSKLVPRGLISTLFRMQSARAQSNFNKKHQGAALTAELRHSPYSHPGSAATRPWCIGATPHQNALRAKTRRIVLWYRGDRA